jgi:hypothetical protein
MVCIADSTESLFADFAIDKFYRLVVHGVGLASLNIWSGYCNFSFDIGCHTYISFGNLSDQVITAYKLYQRDRNDVCSFSTWAFKRSVF